MFTFISETLLLFRLIHYSNLYGKQDRLFFIELTKYPLKETWLGMLWFGWLVIRKGTRKDIPANYIKHRLIHLDQVNDLGGWWKFYWTYLKELIRVNFYCPLNPLEIEAYENQDKEYYVGGNWKRYRGRRKRKDRL